MATSTKFPHHNHLVEENIIQINVNTYVPNVYISLISYCIKMQKASRLLNVYCIKMQKASHLSNVTETRSCKRHGPDHQIN